jgi:hypothetical protein
MTEKNGDIQAPQLRAEEPQMIQLAPLNVDLNSCAFDVFDSPGGGKIVRFTHRSGVICFSASLPEPAVAELIKRLQGGIEIARVLPVMN